MKNLLLALVTIILYSCSMQQNHVSPDLDFAQTATTINSGNAFAFDLYQETIKGEESENAFISPMSAYFALSMLWNGADGESSEAMKKTLKSNLDVDGNNENCKSLLNYLPNVDKDVEMKISNSMWVNQNFNVAQNFENTLEKDFGAKCERLDFSNSEASKTKINNWVSDATNKKIPKIIDNINPDHVLFLINAVYFKGPWKTKFDSKFTEQWDFENLDKSVSKVDMMISDVKNYKAAFEENYAAISLPYANEKYELIAILPNDILSFEKNLSVAYLSNMESKMQENATIHLGFPKLEFEYEKSLNKPLINMGMGNLFSDKANLSKINDQSGLAVDEVKQSTYLKFDEEGTTAAAVTSIGVVTTSFPMNPTIIFSKPFIMVIKEKSTGSILFMGRILEFNSINKS